MNEAITFTRGSHQFEIVPAQGGYEGRVDGAVVARAADKGLTARKLLQNAKRQARSVQPSR